MTEHTDLTGTIRTLETERDGTVRYRVTEDRVYADDLRILTGHLVGSRTGTVTEVLEPADDDEPVSFEEEVGDDLERRAQAEHRAFDVSEEERASARAEAYQLRAQFEEEVGEDLAARMLADTRRELEREREQRERAEADRAAVIRERDQLAENFRLVSQGATGQQAENDQLREANRVARAQMGRILADRAAVIRMCDQLRDERDQLLAQLEGGAHDARAAVRAMSEVIRRAQDAQRLLEGE